MKKLLLFIGIVSFLSSCSSGESEAVSACKVTSVDIQTLSFEDIEINQMGVDPSWSGKFYFEYDSQNRIDKINGGFIPNPPGISPYFYLGAEAHDSISYEPGKIIAHYSANFPKLRPKKIFSVDAQGKLQSLHVTSYIGSDESEAFFTYEYQPNLIIEKLNGKITKKFYFENENLVKLLKLQTSSQGIVFVKQEIYYKGYDQSPNLLKGKFFINGNFLKAFSKNNYKKVESHEYIMYEGQLIENGNGYFDLPYGYNSDGNANLFEYENCN